MAAAVTEGAVRKKMTAHKRARAAHDRAGVRLRADRDKLVGAGQDAGMTIVEIADALGVARCTLYDSRK